LRSVEGQHGTCRPEWEERPSRVGMEGDVHGSGAEGAYEEPREAAGATDGKEFPIPGIVDAQAMAARSDGNRDGAAVHEFRDGFSVELHDDLAELDIVRRGATDGYLCLWSMGRGGRHGRSEAHSQKWLCHLLLEKVLEGLAGVVVARRGRRGGRSSLLRVGGWRGVFLHGGAKFVEGAVVLRVLGGDALRNRLRAFKLRAAVEETALLATVQLESALGTLAVGVKAAGEHCAAIGAARARDGADHARRSRAKLIGARTALLRLAVVRPFLLVLLFRVAIPAVTILSIHKRLRTPKGARQFARKSRASGAWTG